MKSGLKHILLLLSVLAVYLPAAGQAKVGDNKKSIQPGSLMELESTNKGFLNVRLNTTQMMSIPVTAASRGMMVYNTDSSCLCLYNGAVWINMCRQAGQKRVVYLAAAGDVDFLCPAIITDDNNVQVFRNGVQVNFTATIGTRQIRLETEAICQENDEIKIIQQIQP